MAQFCTKCGTPLTEGLKFCTGCGASAGAPGAPPAQAPAAQPPVAPVPQLPAVPAPRPAPVAPAPVPAAPTASSGSPILKIVLIVLAVLIFLGLLSAASCAYFLYRAKQKVNQFEKQAGVTFPMPTGTREVHTQPVAPSSSPAPTPPAGPAVDTGVAVYPGAIPWGGGGQMIGPNASMKTQAYTTSDSVDQVMAFYKDKLGPGAIATQSGGQVVVQTFGGNGGVTVGITSDAGLGKTKISITTIGK
jgi:hypothetical protein